MTKKTRAERRREARRKAKYGDDPCPNGHPEQAQRFMMTGLKPYECPRCGETPQFGNKDSDTSLSLDAGDRSDETPLPPGISVSPGFDGGEVPPNMNCPKCGRDTEAMEIEVMSDGEYAVYLCNCDACEDNCGDCDGCNSMKCKIWETKLD